MFELLPNCDGEEILLTGSYHVFDPWGKMCSTRTHYYLGKHEHYTKIYICVIGISKFLSNKVPLRSKTLHLYTDPDHVTGKPLTPSAIG